MCRGEKKITGRMIPGGMVIRVLRIVYSYGLKKKQNNPIASQGFIVLGWVVARFPKATI